MHYSYPGTRSRVERHFFFQRFRPFSGSTVTAATCRLVTVLTTGGGGGGGGVGVGSAGFTALDSRAAAAAAAEARLTRATRFAKDNETFVIVPKGGIGGI